MVHIDRAEAETLIRSLLARYNTAGDRGRIEELLAVFAPDGVLEIPSGRLHGHAEIGDFLRGVASPGAGAGGIDLRGGRHHLTTSRIEHDEGGDAARGWTYFYVMRAGQVLQEGTYVDRFVRTADDGWRIAHRRVKLLWSLGDA